MKKKVFSCIFLICSDNFGVFLKFANSCIPFAYHWIIVCMNRNILSNKSSQFNYENFSQKFITILYSQVLYFTSIGRINFQGTFAPAGEIDVQQHNVVWVPPPPANIGKSNTGCRANNIIARVSTFGQFNNYYFSFPRHNGIIM